MTDLEKLQQQIRTYEEEGWIPSPSEWDSFLKLVKKVIGYGS